MASAKGVDRIDERQQKRKRKEKPVLAEASAGADAGNSKFAKALGSTDYMTREKGLQALQRWLCLKGDLTEMDMLKIWKGLFFCFWHSDKAPMQADLAQRLAQLISQLPAPTARLYFDTFLTTMRREWFAIDYHRLNKFLMLVRKFIVAMLALLRDSGWDPKLVQDYTAMLQQRVLCPPGDPTNKAAGLLYHLADIYVPELRNCAAPPADAAAANGGEPPLAGRRVKPAAAAAVANGGPGTKRARQQAQQREQQVPGATIEALLHPFVEALRVVPEKAAIARIKSGIFDELADEVATPSEGEPFSQLDAAAFAARLFDLGAAPDVRARNREALYAASTALEQAVAKGKRRKREVEEGGEAAAGEGAATAAAAAGGKQKGGAKRKAAAAAAVAAAVAEAEVRAADIGSGGKRGQQGGEAAVADGKAAPAAGGKRGKKGAEAAAAREPEVQIAPAVEKASAQKQGSKVLTPKQQRPEQQQQGQEQQQQEAATPSGMKGKGKEKGGKGEGQQLTLKQQAAGGHEDDARVPQPTFHTPQPQQQRRKRKGEQRQAGASAGADASLHASGAQSVPAKKRGVVINLKKNIYHKHGAPPPAPDIRTPPSAKPKGSALKTRGSQPATAGLFDRSISRLGAGEARAVPGSAPPKVGGNAGGRVTPGRVARPKAAAFF